MCLQVFTDGPERCRSGRTVKTRSGHCRLKMRITVMSSAVGDVPVLA